MRKKITASLLVAIFTVLLFLIQPRSVRAACGGYIKCNYNEGDSCLLDAGSYTTGTCDYVSGICQMKSNDCARTWCMISDSCKEGGSTSPTPTPASGGGGGGGSSCDGTCRTNCTEDERGVGSGSAVGCPVNQYLCKPSTCFSTTSYNPVGYHDGSDCSNSSGWTCDQDNFSEALIVHFYMDGPPGTGTYIGSTTANIPAEVAVANACGGNANHRFNFITPDSLKDGNTHTIYAYAANIGSGSDVLLTNSPKSVSCTIPVPNCKNLTGPTSIYVGETGTFTATYENGTGTIDQRGLAIYSEGQCEPNTSAYWNRVNGGPGSQSFAWVPSASGTYDVDCRAWDTGVSECRGRCYGIAPYYTYQCVGTGGGATTTRKVTVIPAVLSWWQVKDSDILANGDVRSNVPASYYFDLAGAGGFPGVPVFSGSTNLTSTNVSAKKWMANTSYVSSKVYGSSYFINLIPSGAAINSVTSTSVPGSFFASGGTAYNGYYWYVYDGTANGGVDLTITSGASLGARKVILIVKNADLNLQGNINLTKGSGFFLGITSGNISVSSSVGGGGPNLEGIYIADGSFSSGTGGTKTDSQLSIRGSVAAYGGINLQRDLGNAANSTTPAEYFEYAPDLELLFPKELATRVTNWREVAP